MGPIHLQWKDPAVINRFRKGVSLHSHTLHSRETLDFIYRAAAQAPILSAAIDFLFMRHKKRLHAALTEFHPDLIHITGLSDAGILGALLAYELRVPLVASWHTNIHEFGARRLGTVPRISARCDALLDY